MTSPNLVKPHGVIDGEKNIASPVIPESTTEAVI